MSDNINISYSINLDQPARPASTSAPEAPPQAGPVAAAELLALHDCEPITLNSEMVLLVSLASGRSFPVAQKFVAALQTCRSYRTVAAHLAAIQALLPEPEEPAVLNQLFQALLQAGLLSTATEVCARINGATAAPADALAPTRLFIITCDRPEAVQRLLDSLLDNAELAQHERLYLIDDSRNTARSERNRKLLQTSASRSPIPMHYFGAEEQRDFLEQLAAKEPGLEREIRFLADREQWAEHKSYGLSRTWALLLSAGFRCLVLDDDVLCEAYLPASGEQPLTLADHGAALDLFQSPEDWRTRASRLPVDPLAGHRQCLGKPLSAVLQELGDGELVAEQLADAEFGAVDSLAADSRVLITQCGSLGDPGGKVSQILVCAQPETLERILAEPGSVEKAFRNREFWAGYPRPTLGVTGNMSQITGLDNTRVLPPYFPALRGEDMIFGWMVNQLYPGSRTLSYSWAIPHAPLDSRGSGFRDEQVIGSGGLTMAMNYFSRVIKLAGNSSVEARLGAMSAMLTDLADRPVEELATLFRIEDGRYPALIFSLATRLLARLQDSDIDPDFKELLQMASEQATRRMQSPPGIAACVELPAELSDEDVLARMAAALRAFGASLEAWPRIWRAARELGAVPAGDSGSTGD